MIHLYQYWSAYRLAEASRRLSLCAGRPTDINRVCLTSINSAAEPLSPDNERRGQARSFESRVAGWSRPAFDDICRRNSSITRGRPLSQSSTFCSFLGKTCRLISPYKKTAITLGGFRFVLFPFACVLNYKRGKKREKYGLTVTAVRTTFPSIGRE